MMKPKASKALMFSNAGVTICKENIVSGNLGITLQYGPGVRNTFRAEWGGGKDDILNDGMGGDKPNQRHRWRQFAGKERRPCYDTDRMRVENMSTARDLSLPNTVAPVWQLFVPGVRNV